MALIRVRSGVGHMLDGRFRAVVRLDIGDLGFDAYVSEPYIRHADAMADALERSGRIREVMTSEGRTVWPISARGPSS